VGRTKEVTDEQILDAARRCFVKGGAGVTAVEIGRELGVSHTTIFNRFGSKEALMLAALGPPSEVPWVAELDAGPDARPLREQLVEHAKTMSTYFHELQSGLSLLQAAGIDPSKLYRKRGGATAPSKAYQALVAWLTRAQAQERLAECDIPTLASTLLGALQGWAFKARLTGEPTSAPARERYVERFIELLWRGIGAEHE
jgi:AcrR family transcriptional regulator